MDIMFKLLWIVVLLYLWQATRQRAEMKILTGELQDQVTELESLVESRKVMNQQMETLLKTMREQVEWANSKMGLDREQEQDNKVH